MNIRLQKYKANRLLGMNKYNAGRSAGYSESYCRDHIEKVENSVKIGMADVFEQAGLTDKAIVRHALKGLCADKVISAVVISQKTRPTSLADGELFDANEKTNDFIDVPDWNARHKYFETILKLTDKLREKVEHSGKVETGETKIIFVTPQERITDTRGVKSLMV